MVYNFNVIGTEIKTAEKGDDRKGYSGNVGHYQCRFTFSSEWDGLSKIAVFTAGDTAYNVLLENDACLIPAEVTETAQTVKIGVYASNLDDENLMRISSDLTHIIIKEGAYREGDQPMTPEPHLWETYFAKAMEEAEKMAEKAGQTAAELAKDAFSDTIDDLEEALDRIIALEDELIGGGGV